VTESATVGVLFCDLVGSTARRTRAGDDEADVFRHRFFAALRAAIAETQGEESSNLGDGLMVVFRGSVVLAVDCAVRMHQNVEALDPEDPATLRVGISAGEVANEGSEWFGTPVIQAARLCAAAGSQQTLATEVVAHLVGSRGGHEFRPVGVLPLKGLTPTPTVALVREDATGEVSTVAPIEAASHPRRPGRRGRRALAVGALVVAVAAALVLTTRGSGTSSAGSVPVPHGYTPRLVTTSCHNPDVTAVRHASCGWLIVPQDRSQPQGRQVRLLIEQVPPLEPVGAGSVPTIDLCGCDPVNTSPVREHAELILLPQRGSAGNSPALDCPAVDRLMEASLALPSTDAASQTAIAAATRACRSHLLARGIDPADYNYDAQADDVLDLMSVLGLHQVDLVASYGFMHVAFGLLYREPNVVRSVTTEQPEPPGLSASSDPVTEFANAFGRLVDQCNSSPTCHTAYPDLAAIYRDDFAALQANPVPLPAGASGTGSPPVLFDGTRLGVAGYEGLQQPATYGLVPAALADRSWNLAAGVVVASVNQVLWGTTLSYECSYDQYTLSNAENLAAQSLPAFAAPYVTSSIPFCKDWDVPKLPAFYFNDVPSPVPTFIVAGGMSPLGAANWPMQIERSLPNTSVVTFSTLGGGILDDPPPCLDRLRRQFLNDPAAPLDTAACAQTSPAIQFTANP